MRWTKEDDKVIRHIYPTGSQREVLARLNLCRTWDCVRQRASRLGVSRRNAWTNAEDVKLVEYYPMHDKGLLLRKLPGRNWAAVRARAFRLGVSRSVGRWDAPYEE